MRVHGDKIIKRRSEIKKKSDYHDYLPELREDFQYMCGYCGKLEEITRNAFEIDHFVPKKYDKSRKNDYSNLVYSCYVCNRKKSSKWPSGNAKIQFVNENGFVDPALREYDKHLERKSDGSIYGKTKTGKYMEEAFEFRWRPIREIWQIMQLVKKKKLLREKMQTLQSDRQPLSLPRSQPPIRTAGIKASGRFHPVFQIHYREEDQHTDKKAGKAGQQIRCTEAAATGVCIRKN